MNKSSQAYVLLFMTAICVFFGTLLATVHFATRQTLAENEAFHKNRALAKAFMLNVAGVSPAAYETAIAQSLEKEPLTHEGRTLELYRARGSKDPRLGFVFSAKGFWGPIRGILVLSNDLETIENIEFLDHEETPGLGARIEDPWFTGQFRNLEIAWSEPVERRIVIGAPAGDGENRVEAITGATQTSMALMRSLNQELAFFKEAYTQGAKG